MEQKKPTNNQAPKDKNPAAKVDAAPKFKFESEECFSTSVIGLTGVGKTHKNIEQCKLYAQTIPGVKNGRKVLILNFQNEDGYAKFKTLPPTPEAIRKFVSQKTIEIRQITPIDSDGSAMNSKRKVEVMKHVLANYRNGLAVFDDIDGYAAFGTSSDKDLVGNLMGLRHRGCHTLFAHQAWRKMGVTECENVRFIRLHKGLDSPESMPADKKNNFDMNLLMIAHFAVEAQYALANELYESQKITKEQWLGAKSYCIYIDRWKRKLFPISDKNFAIACRKYILHYPRVIQDEITAMVFDQEITSSQRKSPDVHSKAIQRLTEKFKKMYLPNNK
jgi:hypothetical protein